MLNESQQIYEFAGLRLAAGETEIFRQSDAKAFPVRKKECSFLEAVLEQEGEIASYTMLRDRVWPERADVEAAKPVMRETKNTLNKLLKDISKVEADIIENVSGKGYRISVPVRKVSKISAVTTSDIPFAKHYWHIFFCCLCLAAIYSVALLVEVAYSFEEFRSTVPLAVSLIFVWIFSTNGLAFYTLLRLRHNGWKALLTAVVLSIASGVLVYVALGWYLPNQPITRAEFQTYPAQAAYLKSVIYFLLLTIFGVLIPFHTITSLEREFKQNKVNEISNLLCGEGRKTSLPILYFSPALLIGLFIGAMVLVFFLMAHLLENLQPDENMNLFFHMVLWRWILCLVFGFESLLWYKFRLEKIRTHAETLLRRT